MTHTKRFYNKPEAEDSTFYHPYKQFQGVHWGVCGKRCRHCRSELLHRVYLRQELQAEVPTLAAIFSPGGVA